MSDDDELYKIVMMLNTTVPGNKAWHDGRSAQKGLIIQK